MKMENRTLHICLALIALLAFSCAKETGDVSSEQKLKPITIKAGWAEDNVTRTEIQSDGTTVMWSGEEHIHVFYISHYSYNAGYKREVLYDGEFIANVPNPSVTASFEGMIPYTTVYYNNSGDPTYNIMWAVYPYEGFESIVFESSTSENVTLRNYSIQQAKAGSFSPHSFPAVAKRIAQGLDAQENLVFHNVCGGARFCVSQEGITSVTFRSVNGEPLAGKARVGLDDSGIPVIREIIDGEDGVTVLAPDGGFVPGQDYYAVFFPQTLSEGLSVDFHKGLSVATKTFAKSITINRSRFGILENPDSGLTFSEGSTQDPDGIILFEDANAKAVCIAAFDKNKDGDLSYGEAASVTSIEGVFAGQDAIVTFDEFRYFTGVREIPERGFANCYRLRQITFPDELTTIGPYAFSQCLKLETLKIGKGLKRFEKDAFYKADLLKYVHIPDLSVWMNLELSPDIDKINPSYSVPFYGSGEGHLFMEGKELTDIDIPMGITQVRSCCFYNCIDISKVSFPHGLTTVYWKAFENCKNLKKLCSPSIEDWLSIDYDQRQDRHPFYSSGNGRSLVIGGEEVIHLVLPEGTETVPTYAFFECDRITDLTVPKSLKSIDWSAFERCSLLKNLHVPSLTDWCSVTLLGSSVFMGNSDGHLFVNGQEITTSLIIPEDVTEINLLSFSYLRSLEEVHLPKAFKHVNERAFYGCNNLTRVHIPDIDYWLSASDQPAKAFFEASNEGHLFVDDDEIREVTVPEGVTTIQPYAFAYCKGIYTLVVPKTVTMIGDYAFYETRFRSINMLPLAPPSIQSNTFKNDAPCPIYVDGDFLSFYKSSWPSLAYRLYPF